MGREARAPDSASGAVRLCPSSSPLGVSHLIEKLLRRLPIRLSSQPILLTALGAVFVLTCDAVWVRVQAEPIGLKFKTKSPHCTVCRRNISS